MGTDFDNSQTLNALFAELYVKFWIYDVGQKALVSITCLGQVTKHQSIQVTIASLAWRAGVWEYRLFAFHGSSGTASSTPLCSDGVTCHGDRMVPSASAPLFSASFMAALLAVAESQKPSYAWERHRCYFRWMDSSSKAGQVQSTAPLKY